MESNTETVAPDIFATIPKEETATIIVPMYGYQRPGGVPALNAQMLSIPLFRLRSFFHAVYLIFVYEEKSLEKDVNDFISARQMQGNSLRVEISRESSFGMFLEAGFAESLDKTASRYLIVAAPWQVLGKDSVDVLLERINRVDIGLCSGYDVRKAGVQPANFDKYKFVPIQEFRDFEINFFGVTKPVAQMMKFDPQYKTRKMLEKDLYQQLRINYNIISSQGVPIYPLVDEMPEIEAPSARLEDIERFKMKWKFVPQD